MTTVLITGATGSIGKKLRGHFSGDSSIKMRLVCINPAQDPAVLTADLATYDEAWAQAFEAADVVIHLAGASSPRSNWEAVQRLNIDLSLNVLRASERYGVRRIVFASSNWVVAGHRFGTEALTGDMPPSPINPYGSSKLFIERAGRDFATRTGISFIALRIGYCQHAPGNIPGPHMDHGLWGQQMWLSDRDLCEGFECAVHVQDLPFAVLNLVSANPGMRWDIDTTRRLIGYQPKDGHIAVETAAGAETEQLARAAHSIIERLTWLSGMW